MFTGMSHDQIVRAVGGCVLSLLGCVIAGAALGDYTYAHPYVAALGAAMAVGGFIVALVAWEE